MFTISAEQMDALAQVMGLRFEQRLAQYVQAAFPDEVRQLAAKAEANGEADADGDAVLRFVRTAIDRAEAIRIDADADVAGYLALILFNLRLGPQKADVLGWTRPMLDRGGVPGGLKMDWIVSRLGDFAADDADAAAALQALRDARQHFSP